MIWHHRSDCAPPPTKFSHGNDVPTNLSTVPRSQRELNATPSSTARTISARVVRREMLCQPPRSRWSSTGVRSPFSHGVKITPPAPAGTAAASASMRANTSTGTGVSRNPSSG